jgi:hypothetical protein
VWAPRNRAVVTVRAPQVSLGQVRDGAMTSVPSMCADLPRWRCAELPVSGRPPRAVATLLTVSDLCFDLYVWVHTDDRPGVLARFIDNYVDVQHSREPRLDAFVRTYVQERPGPGDQQILLGLRREPSRDQGFTMYLGAQHHDEAIIRITEEGDLVLGLGLRDPDNSPEVWKRGVDLMAFLRSEFNALGGVAGVELAPPKSALEWAEEAMVQFREGAGP